jgi:hypothetical protein
MIRAILPCVLVTAFVGVSVPAAAQEIRASAVVAPSAAVGAAWAKEEKSLASVKTTKALSISYAALQGADMYSTALARRRGAVEANPLMNSGFMGSLSLKSVMTLSTIGATWALERKNKKAAFITMIALNSVSAIVVANNVRNAGRLK